MVPTCHDDAVIPSNLAFVKPTWDAAATFSVQVRRASSWPETRIERFADELNPPDNLFVVVAVFLCTIPPRTVHLVHHWRDRRTWLLLVYQGSMTSHRPADAIETEHYRSRQLAQDALRTKVGDLARRTQPPARVMYS